MFDYRPTNADELFNLWHAMARNIIERIFGVLKRCFCILVYPAEIDMDLQARIPAALAAIHNFIRIHDPDELTSFTEPADLERGFVSGELAAGLTRTAERRWANVRRGKTTSQLRCGFSTKQNFNAEGYRLYLALKSRNVLNLQSDLFIVMYTSEISR